MEEIMKVLLAILILFLATAAQASPIHKVIEEGRTLVVRLYQPTGEIDEDGDPLETPVQSAAILERHDEVLHRYACLPIRNGEEITAEVPLPLDAPRRPKLIGRSYSGLDCTGLESDASIDWYVVFMTKPMAAELR
jgi:hypothetical protein